jgi:selenocysteine-specific elongation factor
LALANWLTLHVRAVDGAPPLKNGIALRALLGTTELDVRLRLLDRDVLEAGESGFAQLRCLEPVVLPVGEHVILRLASPAGTVGGGRVLETGTRRLRRNAPRILKRLQEMRSLAPTELLASEVERVGASGTTLQQLSRLCGLSSRRIAELLQTRPIVITQLGLVVRKSQIDLLVERIPLLLSPHSAGLTPEKLLAAFPEAGTAVFEEAMARLAARGSVIKRGSQLVIPRPEEDRTQARDDAELAARIAEKLRQGGLTPPNPSALVTDLDSKRAVDRLLRAGVVVRCVDRAKEREVLFHRDAIKDAQHRLGPLLDRPGGLLVTEIGAVLGISRKYSMPLLDHLDAIRFTRRINDRRTRA